MQIKSTNSFAMAAGPLLLVLFIDGMGLGLIVPVLNTILSPENHFLVSETAKHFQHFIFGSVLGIFMLCWFFGAAFLGDLSDHIGRKKSLLICLIGSFLGYALSAFAVVFHSLAVLLIGRMVAGLTSGSQPIAQAAIVDLSTTENKTRNIGYILMALSLGFILGPLLGGILSNNQIMPWFNAATPFYFASGISLINALSLIMLFKDFPAQKISPAAIKLHRAWGIFAEAFKQQRIRNLSIIFLLFILGWSNFYSFITVYLVNIYHLSALDISIYMALMGLGFSIGNGILVNYFSRRYSLHNNALLSILLSAVLVFIMLYCHHAIYLWLLVAPLAAAVAIAYANLLALFSNQVGQHEQGWIMGVTGSIMALVWGIVTIVIGLFSTWSIELPILLTAISFVGASFLIYRHNQTMLVRLDDEIVR